MPGTIDLIVARNANDLCRREDDFTLAVTPWFLVLTAFVGVSQCLYVLTGDCPASLGVKRAFGLRSVMYSAGEEAVR